MTRPALLLLVGALGAALAVTVSAEYERRCYVHPGCRDGISWMEWGGKYGAGWYCNDWVEPFCETGECDPCAIVEDCANGATWDGQEWICDNFGFSLGSGSGYQSSEYDQCFVRQGCSEGITYIDSYSGKYGPGWYCADWEEPYCAEGLCDACDIHSGCTRGASFDGEAWVCNDDDGGGGGAQWDACYVHQGCLHGIFWQEGGPQGSGWYCGDGELADCDKGECDACEIRPNCDTGAIWNEDRWLWECST